MKENVSITPAADGTRGGAKVVWWRTRRTKMTAAAIGAAFVLGIVFWLIFFFPYVSTDDARVAAVLVRVANQGMSARIEKIHVQEGDRVSRGDILVELDSRIAEAQLERARARSRLAAGDLRRAEALAAQSGMSLQQLDKIRADAQSSAADLRLAEIALENTTLKSPVNGVVVLKSTEEGNILEVNQTAVTVVDIDNAWVAANIEETDVGLVKPGQRVRISVDEGGTLAGKVIEVRKAAAAQFALIPSDNAAGNFTKLVQRIPIRVALDPHPGRVLRVGQSVVIRIRVR
jgi:multidrug resistance efflux pump